MGKLWSGSSSFLYNPIKENSVIRTHDTIKVMLGLWNLEFESFLIILQLNQAEKELKNFRIFYNPIKDINDVRNLNTIEKNAKAYTLQHIKTGISTSPTIQSRTLVTSVILAHWRFCYGSEFQKWILLYNTLLIHIENNLQSGTTKISSTTPSRP